MTVSLLAALAVCAFCAADGEDDLKNNPNLVWWKIETPKVRKAKSHYDGIAKIADNGYKKSCEKLTRERDQEIGKSRMKLADDLAKAWRHEQKLGNAVEIQKILDCVDSIEAGDGIPPTHMKVEVGHLYKVFNTRATWKDAAIACKKMGGYLACITSKHENEFVTKLLTDKSEKNKWDLPAVWIGGTDAKTEGKWQWVSGEDFQYANWRRGEPNNRSAGGTEHCLELHNRKRQRAVGRAGEWNDVNGGAKRGFVCEWNQASDKRTRHSKGTKVLPGTVIADAADDGKAIANWTFKSSRATSAKVAYDASIQKTEGQFNRGVIEAETLCTRAKRKAMQKLLIVCKAEVKEVTRKGNLNEALRINDAIQVVEKGVKEGTLPKPLNTEKVSTEEQIRRQILTRFPRESKWAMIYANREAGYVVGSVKKGDKLVLQYVRGHWKASGKLGVLNPDAVKNEDGDASRLVIAAVEGDLTRVLRIMPHSTAKKPFIYVFDEAVKTVVLRINDPDRTFEENPGQVIYKVLHAQ